MQYTKKLDSDTYRDELEFCFSKLKRNVANESAYNYMRGMFKDKKFNKNGFKYSDFPVLKENLKVFAQKHDTVFAHELLVDIYLEKGEEDKMKSHCEKLVAIDPIRKKYWNFLKNNY